MTSGDLKNLKREKRVELARGIKNEKYRRAYMLIYCGAPHAFIRGSNSYTKTAKILGLDKDEVKRVVGGYIYSLPAPEASDMKKGAKHHARRKADQEQRTG